MIGIFEALDWLNAINGRSCLTEEERRLSMLARLASLSDNDVTMMIDRLRDSGLASRDPMERAEVLLNLAAVEYMRRWFPQAARDTSEAIRTYEMLKDAHRHAVASWILGMAQRERSQYDDIYTNWDEARTVFSQGQSNWYQEPVRRMEIDLVACPEEIYTWLNEFQPSSLTPSSWQIIAMVQENIRQGRYSNVAELLADLKEINRWSRDSYELAEACIECGLTAYQVSSIAIANGLIEKAVTDFAPGIGNNHKQAIARCILGALKWIDNSKQRDARLCWICCLKELEELGLQADQHNNQNQRTWYAERRDLLEAALSDQLAEANRRRN